MSKLKMPAKGQSTAMMAALQSEHAVDGDGSLAAGENGSELYQDVTPPRSSTTVRQETVSEDRPMAAPSAPLLPSRQDRLATALERGAQDEIIVVTVRVSVSLNRYMDDYVTRMNRIDPKSRYRKQDAVAEAFAAFYADHPMPPPPSDGGLE
jgi:hypothetical protein